MIVMSDSTASQNDAITCVALISRLLTDCNSALGRAHLQVFEVDGGLALLVASVRVG
jgi:hypothetical protein